MKFSRLICYGNLLLLAFSLCIFRYGFLEQQPDLPLALNDWQFILMIISCSSIAAAGFIINNITGLSEEQIKERYAVNEGTAYYLYGGLNIVGVGLGFYFSNFIGKPGFALVFIVIAATMYFYATSLKYTLIINNLIVALIVAMSILIIGIFDLYPVLTIDNQAYLSTVFKILIDYSVFIFVLAFIREIVKDLRDVDIDYNDGRSTLPIVLGKQRAAKIVFFLALIPIGLLLYYGNAYIINLTWALIYGLVLIMGPMIYFLIKIWGAKTQKEFNQLSLILKMISAFTILSIVVIIFNMKYNA